MERKENRGSGLLDFLWAECGCGYLSDLRLRETVPILRQAAGRIPRGRWPGEAWQEAARYITGRQEIPAAEDEARSALERWFRDGT